ncbi:hypothetical protein D9758_007748 [Tetrapyrgos nigripes]|uniref:Dihydrodipicolinate synthase n=1 Tax=Tetrapyrgos nigripes TaxID=182062 RepID=A0A8H5G5C4_9AGAR|nr:hypothetical protein D9758_007748 [Tetrapyrgos nigripes]
MIGASLETADGPLTRSSSLQGIKEFRWDTVLHYPQLIRLTHTSISYALTRTNTIMEATHGFKKATQEVNKPPVTDHNINDEYMRNPPQNFPPSDSVPTSETKVPGKKEGAYEVEPRERGVLGDEGTGRPKHLDVEGEIVRDNTTHEERAALIRATREALDSVGLTSMGIIAGAGASSTRETITFAKEAAEAGADQVIVIPPGYFAGAIKEEAFAGVKKYFVDVAKASPIPVMMYNFPAVTGDIDMNSDVIEEVARVAPNICGVKLTCGAVGKLSRVAAFVNSPKFTESYPRKNKSAPFIVLGGFVDILYPSVAAGAHGAITGVANFAPRTCLKLWELCQAEPSKATMKEAQELQALVSRADWAAAKPGIPGMKHLLSQVFGYGPLPRGPLLPLSEARGATLMQDPAIVEILEFEKKLAEK